MEVTYTHCAGLDVHKKTVVACCMTVVYQRLKARRGRKRAIVAVAHRILTAVFHMLSTGQPYKDLGVNHLNQPQKQHLLKHMRSRLEQLGYKVTLEAQT